MNQSCRLCGCTAELQESHIIPKFAIKWLKETGTGYFRKIESPNIRRQDGVKQRLLCVECEQRFGSRESYFATQVFKPILAGATHAVYDSRLAYFLVSLFWRTLIRNLDEVRSTHYRFIHQILNAEEEWRRFLLGQGQLTTFSHLHLFVADIAERNPPGVPKFNLYCARACDATVFDSEERCYVVVKFATFFCIAPVTPYVETEWKGTRIENGTGTLKIPQQVNDIAFGGWLMERAKFAFEKFDSTVSSNQKRLIQDHIRKRLPTLRSSDLYRAAMADEQDYNRVLSAANHVGRNDKCPCGSGLKFKKCHGRPL
jgi:hypothetical protein